MLLPTLLSNLLCLGQTGVQPFDAFKHARKRHISDFVPEKNPLKLIFFNRNVSHYSFLSRAGKKWLRNKKRATEQAENG